MCSMAALIALTWVRVSILNRTDQLREEAAGLESQNAQLEEKIRSAYLTAMTSISTSASLGRRATSTALRAG